MKRVRWVLWSLVLPLHRLPEGVFRLLRSAGDVYRLKNFLNLLGAGRNFRILLSESVDFRL